MHSKHRLLQGNHEIGLMNGSQNFADVLQRKYLGFVIIVDQFPEGKYHEIIFRQDEIAFFNSAVGEHDSYLKHL